MAWLVAIHNKVGRYILYGSGSVYIDPDIKRSRSHGYENCVGHQTVTDAPSGKYWRIFV